MSLVEFSPPFFLLSLTVEERNNDFSCQVSLIRGEQVVLYRLCARESGSHQQWGAVYGDMMESRR